MGQTKNESKNNISHEEGVVMASLRLIVIIIFSIITWFCFLGMMEVEIKWERDDGTILKIRLYNWLGIINLFRNRKE